VEAIIMFIQYEKETRKITGYQKVPEDKSLIAEGIDADTGIEHLVKKLTDQARADEVVDFFSREEACEYATNGHIVPYVEPVA
jgi:hypothetical protein